MQEYELRHPRSYHLRLLAVLNDWKRKEEKPTVGELIAACNQADVGGQAKRLLNYKDGSR